jgi:hypothetical protein
MAKKNPYDCDPAQAIQSWEPVLVCRCCHAQICYQSSRWKRLEIVIERTAADRF